MNRKPNAPKCILGVVMVVLLVVGGWATTTARFSTIKTAASTAAKAPTQPRPIGPLAVGEDLLSSVFELEGDITDNPAGAPDDWSAVNCGGGTAFAKTFVHDGTGVSIFTTGGSKDPELLASWRHKAGSVPDKDDIINAYAAKYNGSPNGDDILVFGADRFANDGSAFIGFWFFKSPVFAAADGKFRQGPLATDPIAVHEIGDLLILVEFSVGGTVGTARVLEWVGSGGSESGGTLNDITLSAPNGAIFSISNPLNPQTIPGTCTGWQYTPKGGAPGDPIPTNGFFEGGINLDAFPGLGDACFSTFVVETRSSFSTTSTLKDFALGQFNTCPGVEVTKTVDISEACEGTPVTYTYTVHNLAGQAATVNLVDDNGTPGTGDDIDVDGGTGVVLAADDGVAGSGPDQATFTRAGVVLPTGTTTNIVTATATIGAHSATATATATVVINPNPTCSVSQTATEVCAGGSATLTANPSGGTGGYSYSWSTGATTQSIMVNATGSYSVTVTDSKGCTTSCSASLIVNPNPTCSVNNAERCADGPAQNLTVTPSGGTPGYTFSWTGPGGFTAGNVSSISVSTGGTYTAFVTDSKGCTTSCTGTLTVNPKPTVTINSATCNANATEVMLTATPAGGSGSGYSFSWSTGETSASITKGPGSYTVTVTDSKGCTGTATRKVGVCTD